MPIQAICGCGRTINAKDELAGRRVKCPSCGEAVQIPGGAPPAEPTPPAAPAKQRPAAQPAARSATANTTRAAAKQPAAQAGAPGMAATVGNPLGLGGFGQGMPGMQSDMSGMGMPGMGGGGMLGGDLSGMSMGQMGMPGMGIPGGQFGAAPAPRRKKSSKLPLILGLSGGGVLVLILLVIVVRMVLSQFGSTTVAQNTTPVSTNPPVTPAPTPPVSPAATPTPATAPATTPTVTPDSPAVGTPPTGTPTVGTPTTGVPPTTTVPAAGSPPATGTPAATGTPPETGTIPATGTVPDAGQIPPSGAKPQPTSNLPRVEKSKDGRLIVIVEADRPAAKGPALTDISRTTEGWRNGQGAVIPAKGLKTFKDHREAYGYGWLVELLPHLGYRAEYESIDFKATWANDTSALQYKVIPEFLDPANPDYRIDYHRFEKMAVTHFVGMSGIEDSRTAVNASDLPRSDPNAGIFGYESIAKPAEITDGLSQTIMMIGSGGQSGPWIAGGGATIRGVRGKDYFDDLTGFGSKGLAKKGALVMMADGSVKVLSAEIDPKVFRSMCTIHGSDSVDLKSLGDKLTNP